MGFEERNHKFKIINLKLYMANILITGANGQLGTELRNRSFSLLDDVFYTDVEELDITNFKAICAFIETHDIDTIINCAAPRGDGHRKLVRGQIGRASCRERV